jgi:hypothetical protein
VFDVHGAADVEVHVAVGLRRFRRWLARAFDVPARCGATAQHGCHDHLHDNAEAQMCRHGAGRSAQRQHQQVEGASDQFHGHQRAGCQPPDRCRIPVQVLSPMSRHRAEAV